MESELIEGLAIAEPILERQSDRPELPAPAFQFLLSAGGDANAPLGEGGFDLWDHRAEVAVETPLIKPEGGGPPAAFFTRIAKNQRVENGRL